ncbi:hypothetical protein HDU87_004280 [Geranomyces variabilis]|uniref:Uncharacterized protein n=1 Tax=Geranomyces variabilis TaxID=109894 RepID=A0AAD5TKD9_9FUNG|nr:hypothetical protein HDU87_004280 [Geranomyces variabilis]
MSPARIELASSPPQGDVLPLYQGDVAGKYSLVPLRGASKLAPLTALADNSSNLLFHDLARRLAAAKPAPQRSENWPSPVEKLPQLLDIPFPVQIAVQPRNRIYFWLSRQTLLRPEPPHSLLLPLQPNLRTVGATDNLENVVISISIIPSNLKLGGVEATDEFAAAYVQVVQDDLDADANARLDPRVRPNTSLLLACANQLARNFYGLVPVSATTARLLFGGANGDFLKEAFHRCQTRPYGKLADFNTRFAPIVRTAETEAEVEEVVQDVAATQPVTLQLYIKEIVVVISKWQELLAKHLEIRPADRIWVQVLLNNHPSQHSDRLHAYLYYVGVTIRNPGLRLVEPMQPSAANSWQAAFVKAAELTGALSRVHMFIIKTQDIPVTVSNRDKGLYFHLRTQPAVCDMERFVRLLLHFRALNCAPGGINHTYRLTEASETIIDDAVASAGVLLPDDWILVGSPNPKSQQLSTLYSQTMPASLRNCLTDTEKRTMSSQICDNLLMVPIGSGSPSEVITARLGKDPTLESAATGIQFYEVDKAGLGPCTHTRNVERFYEKLLATAPASPPNGNLAFLGPFRDVFESLLHLNDRVTVLLWLQQVLQVMRPWHIVTLGSPTLGVFVHSLLENTIADPYLSGSTSSDTPRSKFGRPLDSRWDLFGAFVDEVGVPFIAK